MKKFSELLKFKPLVLLLVFASGVFACGTNREFAVARNFTPKEILLALSAMPGGWQVERPAAFFDARKDYHALEAARIVFIADTEIRKSAGHYAYRYEDSARAAKKYTQKFSFSPLGSGAFVPAEWRSTTMFADEEQVVCKWRRFEGETHETLHCEWVARYQEYIVTFGTWILPELMTLDDMAQIVAQIDMTVASFLGISSEQ